MASGGLLDLAGLEAAGANVGAQGAAVLLDPDFLEVRIEAALGGDHRVASGVAERRSLAAAVAYLGHEDGGWYRSRPLRSQPIWRLSRAMRAMVRAALRPWSRLSPPLRARAWSMLSQVMTPKAQGAPAPSCPCWRPRAASAQTKWWWSVSPRMTTPRQATPA